MKFGRRLLIVLAVLLPVPLAAASGLAIPLPATVERLAAKLVPFADPAAIGGAPAFAASSRGRIVVTEDEVTLTNLLTANTTGQTAQVTKRVNEILVRKPKLRRSAEARNDRVKARNERIKKERDDAHGGNRPVRAKPPVDEAPKPKAKPPKPPKPPKEPRATAPKLPRGRVATPEPRKERVATPDPSTDAKASAPKPPRETKKA